MVPVAVQAGQSYQLEVTVRLGAAKAKSQDISYIAALLPMGYRAPAVSDVLLGLPAHVHVGIRRAALRSLVWGLRLPRTAAAAKSFPPFPTATS